MPLKEFGQYGSAVCDTIYTIYISLCTQKADPKPFRGTHCSWRTCLPYTFFLTMFILLKENIIMVIFFGPSSRKGKTLRITENWFNLIYNTGDFMKKVLLANWALWDSRHWMRVHWKYLFMKSAVSGWHIHFLYPFFGSACGQTSVCCRVLGVRRGSKKQNKLIKIPSLLKPKLKF